MALRRIKNLAIEAYAVARDVDSFELLVEDMTSEFPEGWSPLSFDEAQSVLEDSPPETLEFVIVAVDSEDERELGPAMAAIRSAKSAGAKVLVVVRDTTAMTLHQLMRLGADDFAPYPLPNAALSDSLRRLRDMETGVTLGSAGRPNRKGIIMPVYGVSGGVGATTFAVNLAWEMALATKKSKKRVCILDFNFQYGSVATYLDLARREAIYELISDPAAMDHDSLGQALTSFKSQLAVLTAPMDALPLDIVAPEDITRLLEIAASSYDYVIVDMPQALVHWSDHVLRMSETYFALMEIDMRSAQNMLRFLRTLKAEELPYEKVQFALNRAPGFTDLNGKSRVKRLSESLGIDINILLPDGGKQVSQACDQGIPLAEVASKNPLRREIRKIADQLIAMADAERAAVAT